MASRNRTPATYLSEPNDSVAAGVLDTRVSTVGTPAGSTYKELHEELDRVQIER